MKFKTFCAAILSMAFSTTILAQTSTPAQKLKPAEPASLTKTDDGAKARTKSVAENYFSDVELIDQDGRKLRFYSDVLKEKVVVINTFFTTCKSICPPLNRNFQKIQEALGDRLGKDVMLVSITVDPVTDTPTRLKEYGRLFKAQPGWLFLTGKKENVEWALYKLGQYVEAKDDHTSIVIIGNEPKGLWKKAMGLAAAEELIKIVEDVINDR
jgi:protein SCO1/2